MGQKVDPRGFRVGVVRGWISEYFAPTKSKSAEYMVQDIKVRNFIDKFYKYSGISKVVFRKGMIGDKYKNDILIFTAKHALVLGREGKKVRLFKKELKKQFKEDFEVIVKEIGKPELSAKIMGEHITAQLEKRMPYRRVIKTAIEKIIGKGSQGVKIKISGRLNGAEMARSEIFKDGRIPLQKLRADIDYHCLVANTKYGILGIKIWIYKGDIQDNETRVSNKTQTVAKKNPRKILKKVR